jgi:hypothetical protein
MEGRRQGRMVGAAGRLTVAEVGRHNPSPRGQGAAVCRLHRFQCRLRTALWRPGVRSSARLSSPSGCTALTQEAHASKALGQRGKARHPARCETEPPDVRPFHTKYTYELVLLLCARVHALPRHASPRRSSIFLLDHFSPPYQYHGWVGRPGLAGMVAMDLRPVWGA